MKKKNVEKKKNGKKYSWTNRQTYRQKRKKEKIKIPFENEIFPLTINNRYLPEKII